MINNNFYSPNNNAHEENNEMENANNNAYEHNNEMENVNNNENNIDRNFISLQDNYKNYYKILKKDQKNIEFTFPCLPLGFFDTYENYKEYEYSKKIIAPKSLLYQLSEYEIDFPIFLKINELNTIYGIIEFVDYIEHIYIPYNQFQRLNLVENDIINLSILIKTNEVPLAETIHIKPLSKSFFKIKDIKQYLETNLKKMYLTLDEAEVLRLPYFDDYIDIEVEKCLPERTVSIFDIENVNIEINNIFTEEFKRDYEEKLKKEKEEQLKAQQLREHTRLNRINENKTERNNDNTFVPFSGKGRKLGD